MSDEEYECDQCEKTFQTRSGLWKHAKKHQTSDTEAVESASSETLPDDEEISSPSADEEPDGFSASSSDEWIDFSYEMGDPTIAMPSVLKMVAKQSQEPPRKKLSKAEQKIQSTTNVSLLKMGLTGVDTVITKYGRAVMIDETYSCEHSDGDKTMVARAQWEYLKERGMDLSDYLSTGGVALALTGWYVGQPIYQIQQKKKTSLLGKSGRAGRSLLSRIPFIGKRFKKKEPTFEVEVIDDDSES